MIKQLAKTVIPTLGVLGKIPGIDKVEMGVALLQGKGAGTGWDLGAEAKAASRFISSPAYIIDVGGNKGDWSNEIMKYTLVTKHIIMEPQPRCVARLKMRFPEAMVLEMGADKAQGAAQFYMAPDDATWGAASLYKRRETYFAETAQRPVLIQLTTLDDVIGNDDTVDFIKLDIEGAEYNALMGASKALREKRIRALSFEFGGGNINSRTFFCDFWDLLTSLNYRIWRILPGGRIKEIDHYYEDLEYFRGVSNYIASLRYPY